MAHSEEKSTVLRKSLCISKANKYILYLGVLLQHIYQVMHKTLCLLVRFGQWEAQKEDRLEGGRMVRWSYLYPSLLPAGLLLSYCASRQTYQVPHISLLYTSLSCVPITAPASCTFNLKIVMAPLKLLCYSSWIIYTYMSINSLFISRLSSNNPNLNVLYVSY